MLKELQEKIYQDKAIHFNEALSLCQYKDKEVFYHSANEIREYFTGNTIELCSISNARSGKCSEDCKWCAQSSYYNTDIEEYDLISQDEAIFQARQNAQYGVHKYSLVTSGKSLSKNNIKQICAIYTKINESIPINLCASMGLLNEEKLIMLKKAGIKQYHCNLETAQSYFHKMCSTHAYHEKIQTIKLAQDLGFEVCSGGIIGLGETLEQRIELALELRNLNIQSIPINILIPIKGTALGNAAPLTDDDILTTFAIFRFINPKAKIRFAGGRSLIGHIQDKALKTGINAALVGDLLTTIGSNVQEDINNFKKAGFHLKKQL